MELTQKQRIFADAWIENGGNDFQAALKAGYKAGYARSSAKKIRENEGVKSYIAQRQKEIDDKNLISLKEIQTGCRPKYTLKGSSRTGKSPED